MAFPQSSEGEKVVIVDRVVKRFSPHLFPIPLTKSFRERLWVIIKTIHRWNGSWSENEPHRVWRRDGAKIEWSIGNLSAIVLLWSFTKEVQGGHCPHPFSFHSSCHNLWEEKQDHKGPSSSCIIRSVQDTVSSCDPICSATCDQEVVGICATNNLNEEVSPQVKSPYKIK